MTLNIQLHKEKKSISMNKGPTENSRSIYVHKVHTELSFSRFRFFLLVVLL